MSGTSRVKTTAPGKETPVKTTAPAPVKSAKPAPVKSAPVKTTAPVKSAPVKTTAPAKPAPVKVVKSAPVAPAPAKPAPVVKVVKAGKVETVKPVSDKRPAGAVIDDMWTEIRAEKAARETAKPAPVKSAPVKTAPGKDAPVKLIRKSAKPAPAPVAPVKSAPVKSAPVKTTKPAPVAPAPVLKPRTKGFRAFDVKVGYEPHPTVALEKDATPLGWVNGRKDWSLAPYHLAIYSRAGVKPSTLQYPESTYYRTVSFVHVNDAVEYVDAIVKANGAKVLSTGNVRISIYRNSTLVGQNDGGKWTQNPKRTIVKTAPVKAAKPAPAPVVKSTTRKTAPAPVAPAPVKTRKPAPAKPAPAPVKTRKTRA